MCRAAGACPDRSHCHCHSVAARFSARLQQCWCRALAWASREGTQAMAMAVKVKVKVARTRRRGRRRAKALSRAARAGAARSRSAIHAAARAVWPAARTSPRRLGAPNTGAADKRRAAAARLACTAAGAPGSLCRSRFLYSTLNEYTSTRVHRRFERVRCTLLTSATALSLSTSATHRACPGRCHQPARRARRERPAASRVATLWPRTAAARERTERDCRQSPSRAGRGSACLSRALHPTEAVTTVATQVTQSAQVVVEILYEYTKQQ